MWVDVNLKVGKIDPPFKQKFALNFQNNRIGETKEMRYNKSITLLYIFNHAPLSI